MDAPLYIGDAVSAQGYRLAGLQVRVAGDEDLATLIRHARQQAPLVLLSAALASRLAPRQLEALLAELASPMLLVPDIAGGSAMPDLTQVLRRELGVLE